MLVLQYWSLDHSWWRLNYLSQRFTHPFWNTCCYECVWNIISMPLATTRACHRVFHPDQESQGDGLIKLLTVCLCRAGSRRGSEGQEKRICVKGEVGRVSEDEQSCLCCGYCGCGECLSQIQQLEVERIAVQSDDFSQAPASISPVAPERFDKSVILACMDLELSGSNTLQVDALHWSEASDPRHFLYLSGLNGTSNQTPHDWGVGKLCVVLVFQGIKWHMPSASKDHVWLK